MHIVISPMFCKVHYFARENNVVHLNITSMLLERGGHGSQFVSPRMRHSCMLRSYKFGFGDFDAFAGGMFFCFARSFRSNEKLTV